MSKEPTKLQVPPETMKAMWEFFMKTSIPRRMKKRREEVTK